MTNIVIDRPADGVAVVHLPAMTDRDTAPEIRATIVDLINQERRYNLIADMTDVDFIDSTGLAVLIGSQKRAKVHNGTLVLAGPSERIQKVLRVTSMTKVFRIVDTIEQALGERAVA